MISMKHPDRDLQRSNWLYLEKLLVSSSHGRRCRYAEHRKSNQLISNYRSKNEEEVEDKLKQPTNVYGN
ncbi:hypothetical protein Y032_0320g2389 [Ancylostoma ceylanicum]|nr:hypothetical protein Y032_0320g2389 [Ancylostoma ceylanicum]